MKGDFEMIICLSYSKGGVGKTTISANLARVKDSSTDKYMDLFDLDSPQNGSYAVTVNATNLGINVVKTYRYIPTDPTPENTPAEIAKKNNELIDSIIQEYRHQKDKHIIIDCGGHDSDNIRKVLVMCDVIITPLSVSDTELNDFVQWNDEIVDNITQLNPEAKLFVLFNKYHKYEAKDFESIREFIAENFPAYKVLKTTIGDRKDYRSSFGKGKGVVELAPKNPARIEIENLAKELQDILKGD